MAVGRVQAITAIVLAYAVLLLLVSPVVPSPVTTLRSKQMVHPPQGIAPATVLLFASAGDITRSFLLKQETARLLTVGSDVVDLTTVRLC